MIFNLPIWYLILYQSNCIGTHFFAIENHFMHVGCLRGMSFVILIESGCILYNDRCLHFTNHTYVYVCFNGTKAGHARTTNFSNSFIVSVPNLIFKHHSKIVLGILAYLLYTYWTPTTYAPLMEDIATR